MENNRTNWVSLRVGVFCGDIGVDVSQLPPFHLTHDSIVVQDIRPQVKLHILVRSNYCGIKHDLWSASAVRKRNTHFLLWLDLSFCLFYLFPKQIIMNTDVLPKKG